VLDAAPQLLSANPTARVKRPKVSAESPTLGLNKAEAEAFLAAARTSSAADYALACLLLLNGLRVSEALGLDVADLHPEGEHYVAEVVGKGGKVRKAALGRRALAAVTAATEGREAGAVLLDPAGDRMNRHQATRVVRRLARAAGVAKPERISPHSCRHAFVTLSLEAGVPLERVQYAAGHASPETTLRYDRAASALERSATYTLTEYLGA
jgi:site-specific recombinase XerD